MAPSWKSFKLTANFNVPIQSIYDVWAKPIGLEYWFLRRADFIHKDGTVANKESYMTTGDSYVWFWHGYSDEVFEKGKVLAANGKDFFQFTFTENCIVTITLLEKYGLTILELVQDNIPDETNPEKNLYVQCSIGWTFYLANLKSMIEGGIDLRNKNTELHSNFK